MTRYQRPEQPKPIGTIIGVVVALGAVLVFMILMATGVISPKSKDAPAPATGGRGSGISVGPGLPGMGPAGPMAPAVTGAVPGQGVIRFPGRFDEKGNTRRVEILCPSCGKPVESNIPKCPLCSAAIKWPEKVKCGHCSVDKPGACGVCGGTGNCPFCSKGPRMLMGVRPPCDACKQSGKCPACEGTAKCGFCEEGFYYPGKPPPPKPTKKIEPPPPESKPETPPAEGAAPAPTTAPDPAPAPAATE